MCQEHIPNVLNHLKNHGELQFPKIEEIDRAEKTSFVEWKQFGENWYQGEICDEGKRHGRGIVIIPEKVLQIGVYKDGKMNGPFVIIDNIEKVLSISTFCMGKVEGEVKCIYEDKREEIRYFEKGRDLSEDSMSQSNRSGSSKRRKKKKKTAREQSK